MGRRNHYYLSIDDLARARGPVEGLGFDGVGPEALGIALQDALRSPALFERWKSLQDDPDGVDPALGATDGAAQATAKVSDLHIDVDLVTNLPMSIVRQRLNLLIGSSWKLHDMRGA